MKDPNMTVRDSVAWTLTRICEQVPEAALNNDHIENFLNALIENLDSEPRVANNVCWVSLFRVLCMFSIFTNIVIFNL